MSQATLHAPPSTAPIASFDVSAPVVMHEADLSVFASMAPSDMAARAFGRSGHLRLGNTWSTAVADALAADARQGLRTSDSCWATGPVLRTMHADLTRFASTLASQELVPSVAAYRYFEGGHALRLRVNDDRCDLSIFTLIHGTPESLRVHPELVDCTIGELQALGLDPTWDERGGVAIPYHRLGLTALRGRDLPHNRPRGADTHTACVVAELHYRRA